MVRQHRHLYRTPYGREAGYVTRTDGRAGSKTYGLGMKEGNRLVTMDSARRKGRARDNRPDAAAKRRCQPTTRGDPRTPAEARSEVRCRVKKSARRRHSISTPYTEQRERVWGGGTVHDSTEGQRKGRRVHSMKIGPKSKIKR